MGKDEGIHKTMYNTLFSSRFKNQLYSLADLIFFVYIMVKCYVRIDVPQSNYQKALEIVWGCRPRWSVYIMVKCYIGIYVPQPNWYKPYDVS